MLIAALGGEGGGVLASWLHRGRHRQRPLRAGHLDSRRRAAHRRHHLLSRDRARCRRAPRAAGARPVLALNAAPGEVDLVVASELLEATRAIVPASSRPTARCSIASSARVFTDRREGGHGRRPARPSSACAELARALLAPCRHRRFRGHRSARAKSPLNAVLLGAIAASGVLPIAGRGFPRRHPRRGQGGGCEPARLRGRVGAAGSDPVVSSQAGRPLESGVGDAARGLTPTLH